MSFYLSVAFVLLMIAGLLLLRRAGAQQKQTGLPGGRIVYSDTGAWDRVAEPLFSRRHLLAGRPDYLVEQAGTRVPVEVKPDRTAPQPYKSDVLQLATYCLLVEEVYGQRPEYGLIRYRDQTFAVDYTPQLRETLLATLAAMRRAAASPEVNRSHQHPGRCGACGFRADCAQRLA